jgi:hypothetical protein
MGLCEMDANRSVQTEHTVFYIRKVLFEKDQQTLKEVVYFY